MAFSGGGRTGAGSIEDTVDARSNCECSCEGYVSPSQICPQPLPLPHSDQKKGKIIVKKLISSALTQERLNNEIQRAFGCGISHAGLIARGVVSLVVEFVGGGACDKCHGLDEFEEIVSLDCHSCSSRIESALCFSCAIEEEEARGDPNANPTRVFVDMLETPWTSCVSCSNSYCDSCNGALMRCGGCMTKNVLCPYCVRPGECICPEGSEFIFFVCVYLCLF
ncbi:hypothetical protein AAMO2058_001204600 [Amorphochlora amoebiformis]